MKVQMMLENGECCTQALDLPGTFLFQCKMSTFLAVSSVSRNTKQSPKSYSARHFKKFQDFKICLSPPKWVTQGNKVFQLAYSHIATKIASRVSKNSSSSAGSSCWVRHSRDRKSKINTQSLGRFRSTPGHWTGIKEYSALQRVKKGRVSRKGLWDNSTLDSRRASPCAVVSLTGNTRRHTRNTHHWRAKALPWIQPRIQHAMAFTSAGAEQAQAQHTMHKQYVHTVQRRCSWIFHHLNLEPLAEIFLSLANLVVSRRQLEENSGNADQGGMKRRVSLSQLFFWSMFFSLQK